MVPQAASATGPRQYRRPMMGMGNLGPDGRRRQRLIAGIIVAAMVLAAGAVLLGSLL